MSRWSQLTDCFVERESYDCDQTVSLIGDGIDFTKAGLSFVASQARDS